MTKKEKEESRLQNISRLQNEISSALQQLNSTPKAHVSTDDHIYNTDTKQVDEPLPSVEENKRKLQKQKEMRDLAQNLKTAQNNLMIVNLSYDQIASCCEDVEKEISELNEQNLETIFNQQAVIIDDFKKKLYSKIAENLELQSKVEAESQKNKSFQRTINKTNYLDEECQRLRNNLDVLDSQYFQLEYQQQNANELLQLTNDNMPVLQEKIDTTQKRINSKKKKVK